MDMKDKHIYESNLLAFKFGLIIQIFELLATLLYGSDRVGFLTTAVMAVLQSIILAASIVFFALYKKRTRGQYLMMTCMILSYLVVMLGSVHVTYMWAFGPSILILVLL